MLAVSELLFGLVVEYRLEIYPGSTSLKITDPYFLNIKNTAPIKNAKLTR
jgi:hypothetical protein